MTPKDANRVSTILYPILAAPKRAARIVSILIQNNYEKTVKHYYEKPETEVWNILQEKNILSGEKGSNESVSYDDDPFARDRN